MSKTKVSSRGQTVIPHSIRERYGIKTGSRVEWLARDSETILVRKVTIKKPTDWSVWAQAWRGLGKEVWKGIDPVEYTHQIWDHE